MAQAITVVGGTRLQAQLARSAAAAPRAINKMNKEVVADVIVPEGRRQSPVQTGDLRGTVRPGGRKDEGRVYAGTASVPYAGVIHFGWPAHGIEPNPFLYRALDRRRREVVDRYEKAVSKLIADNF